MIAGIDYSMTSPAICIFDTQKEFNFDNCEIYFMTQLKKYEIDHKNIHSKLLEFTDAMDRYDKISSYFLDIILKNDVQYVCIEDYSMGSKGRVFHIAENTGILKYRLWNAKVPFNGIPPTVIKKFATGKGNADKGRMQEVFESENSIRLKREFNMTEKQWNPSSDIIDAYWICKYGFNLMQGMNNYEHKI
jgi:Holliday junction resolvasome RuvABC endonuclease subunit